VRGGEAGEFGGGTVDEEGGVFGDEDGEVQGRCLEERDVAEGEGGGEGLVVAGMEDELVVAGREHHEGLEVALARRPLLVREERLSCIAEGGDLDVAVFEGVNATGDENAALVDLLAVLDVVDGEHGGG